MNFRSFAPRFFFGFLFLFSILFTNTGKVHSQGIPVYDNLNVIQSTIQAVHDVGDTLKEFGLDGIAKMISQQVIKQITKSIVTWINSGFDGNPSFVTDPVGFFENVGEQVSGKFLSKAGLNFLCEPFKANIRLSLILNLSAKFGGAGNGGDFEQQYKCTLSKIIKNAEGFGKFMQNGGFVDNGGWKSWFEITQNPSNNPIGASIAAKAELDSRIGNAQAQEQMSLNWGQGFLSWKGCDEYAKVYRDSGGHIVPFSGNYSQSSGEQLNNLDGSTEGLDQSETPVLTNEKGECTKESTRTPGSVIKSQLDQVLPKELDGIVAADEINEIASALANQLLTQVITGFNGLAGASKPKSNGKTALEAYAAEINQGSFSNVKKALDTQITRTYSQQVGKVRYLRFKEVSLSIIQPVESAENALLSCYATKATSTSIVSTSTSTPTINVQNAYSETLSILNDEIIPVRKNIENDIQNVNDRITSLQDLKKELDIATTPEDLDAVAKKLQDTINAQTNLQSERRQVEGLRDEYLSQAQADLPVCQSLP